MQRRTLLAASAAALCASPTGWARAPSRPVPAAAGDARIGTADLARDHALLSQVLRTLHPGLFRYAGAADVRARLAALAARWSRPQTCGEAWLALAPLLASIRCGHTFTNPANQSDAVRAAVCTAAPRLPLHFAWPAGRMQLQRPHEDLPAGTEVLQLDGVPAARLRATLAPLMRVDGHNTAAAAALLGVTGREPIEAFDIFHPLCFGARERFRVQLRLPDGRLQERVLEGISHAQRQAMRPSQFGPGDAHARWTLALRPDGVAHLAMPSWAVYDDAGDWRAWLADARERIATAGVRGLVIDLRGNEGGLDCGDALLAGLIDRPLAPDPVRRLVRYRRVPAALNPFLDTWDDRFRDWGDAARDAGQGFYTLGAPADDGEGDGRIRPAGPRLPSRVAVLVEGLNHSATFRFARLVQQHRLGVLVGSPTGGNRRGINGGAFFFLRLPGSGIEVDIPLIGTYAVGRQPDGGLRPDVPVVPTGRDLAVGRDGVLECALRALG